MSFNYYHHHEANQFAFFRIPKVLFTDRRFAHLSTDAKLLYGLLLDRMALSAKNDWFDSSGHVFIYFTVEEVQALMGISPGTAVKLFSELDCKRGVGLIKRLNQGRGRPAIIYVKNFAAAEDPEDPPAGKEKPSVPKAEAQTSQNRNSRLPKNGSLEFQKLEGNNTEYNKTEYNNLSIINVATPAAPSTVPGNTTENLMDRYRQIDVSDIVYSLPCAKPNHSTQMQQGHNRGPPPL